MQKILCNVNTFHLHQAWLCIPLFVSVYIRISIFGFHFFLCLNYFVLLWMEICFKLNEFPLRHKKIQWICFFPAQILSTATSPRLDQSIQMRQCLLICHRKAYIDSDTLCIDVHSVHECGLCVEISINIDASVYIDLISDFLPFLAWWITKIWFKRILFPHFSLKKILPINSVADVVYLFNLLLILAHSCWTATILFGRPSRHTLWSQFLNRYDTYQPCLSHIRL